MKVRLDRVHRAGAALFGLGIAVFGVLGLADRLDPFAVAGRPLLGLSTNGLLSVVSLVVGAVLVGAAVRGGRTASTITTVVGALFVLSGLVNVLVLETPFNLLAFEMPNVIFSLVAGAFLLVLGSYGRFTGRLPDDNPYRGERPAPVDMADAVHTAVTPVSPADAAAARELAEAERAASRNAATPEQLHGLAAARRAVSSEDRLRAWREVRSTS
jgi:hypothetical protein